jgi:hypothetical protein
MLSRYRGPRTDLEEMGNPISMPVRQDNWGTTVSLIGPDVFGVTVIESRDLIDVTRTDDQSGPFTIALTGPHDALLAPGIVPMTFGLQAEIIWGTGGAFSVARCDWVRGQLLSVAGGRLRVRVVWQQVIVNAAPTNISVGAFAANSALHGHRPAQLTTYLGNLIAGPPPGFETVAVPIMARRLVLTGTPVNAPLNVDFLHPTGGVINNYVVAFYPSLALPIPNGARWVTVTNGSQAACSPRLIWELDL